MSDLEKAGSAVDLLKKHVARWRWFFGFVGLIAGMLVNATYNVIGFVQLPYQNDANIIIAFERLDQITEVIETLSGLEGDLMENGEKIGDAIVRIERLEGGQIELRLRVERLDERTGGQ